MRVTALNRKLLREAWRARGQMISIALVVACGIMTVVMMRSTSESLAASQIAYYRQYQFADLFASLVRAPTSLAARLGEIEGVAAVDPRVVLEVNLDVPGLDEPAQGRLVSIPPGGPRLNRVHLVEGRFPEANRGDEVVISSAFSNANSLELGATIGAVVNGRWERLRIVGIGMSPEYVYEVSAGQIFPDNRRFGILWMDRTALAAAAGMTGSFNDIAVRLARGANPDAVIDELDRFLEGYGSLGAYDRDRQLSHRILTDELESNRISGTVIPAIFLAVAAFLLHIVLSRLVRTQREQIAVLKAFGYSNIEIGRHFLHFALVAVVIGALVGTGVGTWLGRLLLELYRDFFQFPQLYYRVSWFLVAMAIAVSAGAAVLGALSAVRSAVRLPPAEAMRPEAPTHFRPGLIERSGIGRILSPIGRMIIRSLDRQPMRAALSALAVALAISILLVGSFMFDAVSYMADLQFRTIQREDLTVLFNTPKEASARHDLANLEGVSRVEVFRSVPVRLDAGHRSRQLALTGLGSGSQLRRILDTDLIRYEVAEDGVLLSRMLADIVGVSVGDTLHLKILEGRQPERRLPVAGVVEETLGLNAYMEIGALNRLMREAPTISGAYLRVDERQRTEIFERLKRMPAIAGVAARENVLENFEFQLEQNLLLSMTILVLFAGVIAVGVIYNGARIALSERGRELASLRVLGFTKREIAVILFGEQTTVTALGIPIGFLIGLFFVRAILGAFANENYRIPLVVTSSTYAFAAIVAISAALFAGLLVRRRLNRLDLIEVLKTRE
ncbi:MAG: FtsX-like permease family protein [Gemmatimonas sp.]|nr:FtsX-like permease family protein [Gemmatimonas sp.]